MQGLSNECIFVSMCVAILKLNPPPIQSTYINHVITPVDSII